MASEPLAQIALLSIHPEYASAILEGKKKVEFRRKPFARPVDKILVYATSPVQALVGFFKVSGVFCASPEELWEEYGEIGCIEEASYLQYYAGCGSAVAIGVDAPVAFDQPIDLAVLGFGSTPPQSFRYVPLQIFEQALKSAQTERIPEVPAGS